MCNKEKALPIVNWKTIGNKLIYGLLYPAYFGNMVYDLFQMAIQLKNGNSPRIFSWAWVHFWGEAFTVTWMHFWTGAFIVLFYIIDYMHLHSYIHEVVPEDNRNGLYLFCDLITTHLIFFAFAYAKYGGVWKIHLFAFISSYFYPLLSDKNRI